MLSWLAALLACVFLVPGAYSIEIGFSAEDGGESTGLSSSYDVDTYVSVSEESTASFDLPTIENTRSVAGTGDINVAQTYSGSKGYRGESRLAASSAITALSSTASLTSGTLSTGQTASISGKSIDASQQFAGSGGYRAESIIHADYANSVLNSKASLTTETLSFGQGASIEGASGEISLGGVQGSESARQFASFESGWIGSGQEMNAGHSVYTSQDTTLMASKGSVGSQASADGKQAATGLLNMVSPALVTEQMASAADGTSRTDQFTLLVADGGYVGSSADGFGAHADVGITMDDGLLIASQNSISGNNQIPVATMNLLAFAGNANLNAHSSYPSPGFGYLSYASAVGPGDKIPVAEGKESWGFNLVKMWQDYESEQARKQIAEMERRKWEAWENPAGHEYEVPIKTWSDDSAQYKEFMNGDLTIMSKSFTFTINTRQFSSITIDAIGSEGCINADVGNAKKAIILEPMYTAFSQVASDPSQSDAPYETEGDAAYRCLVDSGYATWRYMDTAATKEHFQEMDDYNAALVVSHMNSYVIALSTPSDNPDEGEMVYAWDLNDWYTNPSADSLVLLSGCESAGPGFLGIYDLSLFGALDEADTVAGFPGSVYTGWAGDSVSELFKYMNEHPGSTISQAQSYIWNDFRPNWEARHFSGSGVQNLEIAGDGNWKL